MKKQHPNPGLGRELSVLIQGKDGHRTQMGIKETTSLVRGLSALLGVSENKEKGNV